MKKIIFLALLFAVACNDNKKQASAYLGNAQNLYEVGEYVAAKHALDSLKVLFPKEFEVLKQGLQLSRQVEVKIQERNLLFCDSLLLVRQSEFEIEKSGFLFEKDPEYDDIGKYVDKQQKLENKLQRSYIRINVNELGELALSSVYYGSQAIRHSALKVSKSDGEYMETQNIPFDGGVNYTFVDLGMTTEVVTYIKGKDNGVIQFIYNNKDAVLKAEYLGGKKYTLTLSQADKKSLVKTVDFAFILSDIEKLKKEKEKSTKRIEYLETELLKSDK
jgi:predicted Ser/Thr protein kinase